MVETSLGKSVYVPVDSVDLFASLLIPLNQVMLVHVQALSVFVPTKFTIHFLSFWHPYFTLIADTLERPVEVNVVIDKPYEPEYDNEESPKYQEFVETFTNKVNWMRYAGLQQSL